MSVIWGLFQAETDTKSNLGIYEYYSTARRTEDQIEFSNSLSVAIAALVDSIAELVCSLLVSSFVQKSMLLTP